MSPRGARVGSADEFKLRLGHFELGLEFLHVDFRKLDLALGGTQHIMHADDIPYIVLRVFGLRKIVEKHVHLQQKLKQPHPIGQHLCIRQIKICTPALRIFFGAQRLHFFE